MSGLGGTPFDELFETLTARMGVMNTTEIDPSQRTRVVWARAGAPEPRPIPYRVAGERTIGRLAHAWTATVHGSDDLEVTGLLHQLQAHLDDVLGPPQGAAELETPQADKPAPLGRGYELKPGKLAGVVGLDGTAAGVAQDLTVTVYTRVRTRIRGVIPGAPSLRAQPLDPDSLATPADIAWSAPA